MMMMKMMMMMLMMMGDITMILILIGGPLPYLLRFQFSVLKRLERWAFPRAILKDAFGVLHLSIGVSNPGT